MCVIALALVQELSGLSAVTAQCRQFVVACSSISLSCIMPATQNVSIPLLLHQLLS
jgi:hypothetical protein